MSEDFEKLIRAKTGENSKPEPKPGHEMRFRARLEAQEEEPKRPIFQWKIAAVIIPLMGLSLWFLWPNENSRGLTQSDPKETETEVQEALPELAEVESFFEQTLADQIKLVDAYQMDVSDPLRGYLAHLDTLEKHYSSLKQELGQYGWNDRIQASLINNYQLRIEILQALLQQLDQNSRLKKATNENFQNT